MSVYDEIRSGLLEAIEYKKGHLPNVRVTTVITEYDPLSGKEKKTLVRKWGPDFTKVTPAERAEIEKAEQSGFIPDSEIDWNVMDNN